MESIAQVAQRVTLPEKGDYWVKIWKKREDIRDRISGLNTEIGVIRDARRLNVEDIRADLKTLIASLKKEASARVKDFTIYYAERGGNFGIKVEHGIVSRADDSKAVNDFFLLGLAEESLKKLDSYGLLADVETRENRKAAIEKLNEKVKELEDELKDVAKFSHFVDEFGVPTVPRCETYRLKFKEIVDNKLRANEKVSSTEKKFYFELGFGEISEAPEQPWQPPRKYPVVSI